MIQLDAKCLQKIMSNQLVDTKPILQVLNIRNISSVNQGDRYLLLLSDSVYFESACLLLPNLNSFIKEDKLKKDTIIQLDNYALNSIPNGKVLVIVDLTIITNDYPKIGNPIALTQKTTTTTTTTTTATPIKQSLSSPLKPVNKLIGTTSTITFQNNNNNNNNSNSNEFIMTTIMNDNISNICKCSNCQDRNALKACYNKLGLNENATKDEVKTRYLALISENNEKIKSTFSSTASGSSTTKIAVDPKIMENFESMKKAYTLIMGMKSDDDDDDDDDDNDGGESVDSGESDSGNGGILVDDTATTTTTTTNTSSANKQRNSKSKVKIPLEDFLQYAWMRAADEYSYDTDSDSECDVGFHRRKNRNPKAFYQQLKKNNKTLSIKAMKKRAKELSAKQQQQQQQQQQNSNFTDHIVIQQKEPQTQQQTQNTLTTPTTAKQLASSSSNSNSSTSSGCSSLNSAYYTCNIHDDNNATTSAACGHDHQQQHKLNFKLKSSFANPTSATTATCCSSNGKCDRTFELNAKFTCIPSSATITSPNTDLMRTKFLNEMIENKFTSLKENENQQTTPITVINKIEPLKKPLHTNSELLAKSKRKNKNKKKKQRNSNKLINQSIQLVTQQQHEQQQQQMLSPPLPTTSTFQFSLPMDAKLLAAPISPTSARTTTTATATTNSIVLPTTSIDNNNNKEQQQQQQQRPLVEEYPTIEDDDDDDEDDDANYEDEEEFGDELLEQGVDEDDDDEVANDEAVSTIAANIENLTNAFITKDNTPENVNLKEKLKNIVCSLQTLQKVIDNQDFKMLTSLTTNKLIDENQCLHHHHHHHHHRTPTTSTNTYVTSNLLPNFDQLVLEQAGHGDTDNIHILEHPQQHLLKVSQTDSCCHEKHKFLLTDLIDTQNELNEAKNRKLKQQISQLNESLGSIRLTTAARLKDRQAMQSQDINEIEHKLILCKQEISNFDVKSLSDLVNAAAAAASASASQSDGLLLNEHELIDYDDEDDENGDDDGGGVGESNQGKNEPEDSKKVLTKKDRKKLKKQDKRQQKAAAAAAKQAEIPQVIELPAVPVLSPPKQEDEPKIKKKKKNKQSKQVEQQPQQTTNIKSNNKNQAKQKSGKSQQQQQQKSVTNKIVGTKLLSDLDSFSNGSFGIVSQDNVDEKDESSNDDSEDDLNDNDDDVDDVKSIEVEKSTEPIRIPTTQNDQHDDNTVTSENEGDWIQVKKSSTKQQQHAIIANSQTKIPITAQQTNANRPNSNIDNNNTVNSNIISSNGVSVATSGHVKSKSASGIVLVDNSRKLSAIDTNFDVDCWASKISGANSTTKQQQKPIVTSTNSAKTTTTGVGNDEIKSLEPKSLDEEEIMLKKALELSLKETSESTQSAVAPISVKQTNVKPPVVANTKTDAQPQVVKKQSKLDSIDDISLDLSELKKDLNKPVANQQPKLPPSKPTPVPVTVSAATTKPTARQSTKLQPSPNKQQKMDDSATVAAAASTTTRPKISLLNDEQQKQINNKLAASNQYTNGGISYAAKSAKTIDVATFKSVVVNNTKQASHSANTPPSIFTSSDDFPHVSVANAATTVKPEVVANKQQQQQQQPKQVAVTAKTGRAAPPTQTVNPLPKEIVPLTNEHPVVVELTSTPILLVAPAIRPPTPQLVVQPVQIHSLPTMPILFAKQPERPSSWSSCSLTPPANVDSAATLHADILNEPVVASSLKLSPNNIVDVLLDQPIMPQAIKRPFHSTAKTPQKSSCNLSFLGDFEENGVDVPIDAKPGGVDGGLTSTICSPKKPVGAERPIGWHKTTTNNIPTAIVAPTTQHSISKPTIPTATVTPIHQLDDSTLLHHNHLFPTVNKAPSPNNNNNVTADPLKYPTIHQNNTKQNFQQAPGKPFINSIDNLTNQNKIHSHQNYQPQQPQQFNINTNFIFNNFMPNLNDWPPQPQQHQNNFMMTNGGSGLSQLLLSPLSHTQMPMQYLPMQQQQQQQQSLQQHFYGKQQHQHIPQPKQVNKLITQQQQQNPLAYQQNINNSSSSSKLSDSSSACLSSSSSSSSSQQSPHSSSINY